MNTPGARVIREGGAQGLLDGGARALFNVDGECPACCVYDPCECTGNPGAATATGLLLATVQFDSFSSDPTFCQWAWIETDQDGVEVIILLTYYIDLGDWGIEVIENYPDLTSCYWGDGASVVPTCVDNKIVFSWPNIPTNDPDNCTATVDISVGA